MLFSNGWVSYFKTRNGFRCHRSQGESDDASVTAVEAFLPQLQEIVQSFARKDVFNADEFGLFYKRAPTTTISPRPLQGRKVNKEKITFLPWCNSDGSERLPPLVVGKARRPMCFGGWWGGAGFSYESGPKA